MNTIIALGVMSTLVDVAVVAAGIIMLSPDVARRRNVSRTERWFQMWSYRFIMTCAAVVTSSMLYLTGIGMAACLIIACMLTPPFWRMGYVYYEYFVARETTALITASASK